MPQTITIDSNLQPQQCQLVQYPDRYCDQQHGRKHVQAYHIDRCKPQHRAHSSNHNNHKLQTMTEQRISDLRLLPNLRRPQEVRHAEIFGKSIADKDKLLESLAM